MNSFSNLTVFQEKTKSGEYRVTFKTDAPVNVFKTGEIDIIFTDGTLKKVNAFICSGLSIVYFDHDSPALYVQKEVKEAYFYFSDFIF